MAEYIFPLPNGSSDTKGTDVDEVAWTDRLLNIVKFLDETTFKSLLSMSGLKTKQVVLCIPSSAA